MLAVRISIHGATYNTVRPIRQVVMEFILYLSEFLVPILIFCIAGYGMLQKVSMYDCFVRGAEEGINTVVKIAPTLVGLMVATGVLRASGLLELVGAVLTTLIGDSPFPAQLVPLTVVRLFSGSAATGLLLDVYKEFGTDSLIGTLASLLMCCTETVFYTMSIYFMTVGIKKTRHTLTGALLATFSDIVVSVILAGWMTG